MAGYRGPILSSSIHIHIHTRENFLFCLSVAMGNPLEAYVCKDTRVLIEKTPDGKLGVPERSRAKGADLLCFL